MTGSYENWAKKGTPLAKEEGVFKGQIKVDKKQKLVFKFIADGDKWMTSENYKLEVDENGILNNYVDADELTVVEEFEQGDKHDDAVVTNKADLTQDEEVGYEEGEESGYIKGPDDVLTASSSFAAIPSHDSSTYSKYDISSDYEIPREYSQEYGSEGVDAGEEEESNQFNTPTNSVFNSTIMSPTKDRPSSTADTSILNVDTKLQHASDAPKEALPHKNEFDQDNTPKEGIVEIMKVPGAFPSPTASESNTNTNSIFFDKNPPAKKETLLSRFKNLFKS